MLRYRGSARQELADLNGDLSLVESAIEDFEQALSIQGTGSLDTVEILHSLAQSHFRWACLERDTRQTSAAIDRINEAIYIVENSIKTVSYTHLRAHETVLDLVCRLLLEKKK